MNEYSAQIFNLLEQVRLGGNPESYLSPEAICLMNDAAIDIVRKDSLLSIEAEDVQVLNALIEISNIIYNETDLDILPLDDGIYDMLMIIVKKYNPNYQIGARPTIFQQSQNNADEQIINPFIMHDPRLNDNMFGRDIQFEWQYKNCQLKPEAKVGNKKIRDTAHNHPELVGTLDKCKFIMTDDAIAKGMLQASNVEILQRDFFEKHMAMGLYRPDTILTMICELKYDGLSVEADVTDKVLSARSRGDTNNDKATDYTEVLAGYPFPNASVLFPDGEQPIGMKFEAILTNAALRNLNRNYGKGYKNARNAVSGLLSAKDAYRWQDYITLVPLSTTAATTIGMNRQAEIEFLNKYYFNPADKIFYQVIQGNVLSLLYQIREFAKAAEYARPSMSFMYDGIVVSYMDYPLIQALGRVNSVNKWQMAIKFEAIRKETIFLGYDYSVGQNGVITPMIYYRPIEFFGCIHNHSSGHSYARFQDLQLRVGDRIEVEYTNDVMPYVTGKIDGQKDNTNPIVEFPMNCPCCGGPLQFSEKSAVCINPGCPDRLVARATNMLKKLSFMGFSEAAVKKLNIVFFKDLMSISKDEVAMTLGDKLAENFEEQRNVLKTQPLYDYRIFGAIGFSNIAEITWRTILSRISMAEIMSLSVPATIATLQQINGVGEATAMVIAIEKAYFSEDIGYILQMPNLVISKGTANRFNIRFTGCRDKELSDYMQSLGYDCGEGGVSARTRLLVVPYIGHTSSKTRAAKYAQQIALSEFRKDPVGIFERLISTMP